MPKRYDYISWDEFFMGAALLCAKRSKDPNTQVGACIVNNENRILSVGYNGFPSGCDEYLYVCHAELNAILNCRGRNLTNSRIYVALFPCNECAKAIIQSGIKEVIYLSDKYADTPATKASKRMFDAAGVKYTKLFPEKKSLTLDFSEENI